MRLASSCHSAPCAKRCSEVHTLITSLCFGVSCLLACSFLGCVGLVSAFVFDVVTGAVTVHVRFVGLEQMRWRKRRWWLTARKRRSKRKSSRPKSCVCLLFAEVFHQLRAFLWSDSKQPINAHLSTTFCRSVRKAPTVWLVPVVGLLVHCFALIVHSGNEQKAFAYLIPSLCSPSLLLIWQGRRRRGTPDVEKLVAEALREASEDIAAVGAKVLQTVDAYLPRFQGQRLLIDVIGVLCGWYVG